MKKKLAFGLISIMVISALSGCGKKASNYLLDVDYSDYVTLCEYKGVEATKINFDVSAEEIQESIEDGMYDYATYDTITDRGIEIGDYANIDYIATLDGEESEDYSGESEDILVGEGYIYPEVEDALVGMKTGESKTVEVEFTEDYADEEDVGKKASVEVKVNEISVENLPEYNEEFVKENLDYDSMEEYEAAIKEELLASKEEEYKYVTVGEIFEFIVNNSEFNGYPDELYTQCEENYDSNNAYYAAMYGMELEDYLDFFGIDDATREQDIKDSVNQELIIGLIAQKEGIECTEDEIEKFVDDIYEDYGYDSADEFLEDYSKEEIGYEVIYEKVIDLLYANAKYIEISEEEYLKEQEEEYLDDVEEEEDSTDAEAEEDSADTEEEEDSTDTEEDSADTEEKEDSSEEE